MNYKILFDWIEQIIDYHKEFVDIQFYKKVFHRCEENFFIKEKADLYALLLLCYFIRIENVGSLLNHKYDEETVRSLFDTVTIFLDNNIEDLYEEMLKNRFGNDIHFQNELEIGQLIGKGAYSEVYEYGDHAIKHMELSELHILHQLSKAESATVVEFKKAIYFHFKIYAVMERSNSTLHEYILAHKVVPWKQVCEIFMMLEKHDLTHGDLHAKNILICGDRFKLCDFGKSYFGHDFMRDLRYFLSYLTYCYDLDRKIYEFMFPELGNSDEKIFFNRHSLWVIDVGTEMLQVNASEFCQIIYNLYSISI
jgi:hypothetical protein